MLQYITDAFYIGEIMKKSFKLSTLMIIACALIFAVSTFVLEPLLVLTNSDVTLKFTPLPYLFDVLCDLFELAAFAVSYSIIIFAAVAIAGKQAWRLFGIYCTCCAARRIAVLLISIHSIDELGITSLVLALVLEYTAALVITLVSVRDGGNYRELTEQAKKAALVSGDSSALKGISFDRVFDKDNPYLVSALKAAVLLVIVTVGRRIISDIIYGAPTSVAEVLVMAAYYLFDVLMCVIAYTIMWLLLARLANRN